MRNNKGFTLIEMLAVLVVLALIISLTTLALVGEINKARGNTLMSEARMVLYAAYTVILENTVAEQPVSDSEYRAGLTGFADDMLLGTQAKISARMQSLLEPDILLAEEPSEEAANVNFIVENGVIVSMDYRKMIGSVLYTVTIMDGGERQAAVRYEKIR